MVSLAIDDCLSSHINDYFSYMMRDKVLTGLFFFFFFLETYLRERQVKTEFDRHDFDCLSNKFLSKLVIRAN